MLILAPDFPMLVENIQNDNEEKHMAWDKFAELLRQFRSEVPEEDQTILDAMLAQLNIG